MNPLVPDFILRHFAAGRTSGTLTCPSLFADISGFTALTTALMAHDRAGAEELALALRFYFDPLVAAVHQEGGVITGFAGDAFTALFPGDVAQQTCLSALRAAFQMQSFFAEHPFYTSPFGQFAFGLKLGLSFGACDWRMIELSEARSTYFFQGPAIDQCAQVEHQAAKGETLYDLALATELPESAIGLGTKRATDGLWNLVKFPEGSLVRPQLEPLVDSGQARRFLPSGTQDVPIGGEFRNVAALFLSFDCGEEVPAFLSELQTLLERYGGTFNGLDFGDKGGNTLMFFGAPVAHENDLERAALFIQALLDSGKNRWKIRAGLTFDLCFAGPNGGRKRHVYTVLGSAVNLAARLMMAAPWGKAWMDPAAAAQLRRFFDLESHGEHQFKGFQERVKVYALGKKKKSSGQLFQQTQMIGRQAKLELLEAKAQPLFENRLAGLIYVDGEAGVGKSLLIERFRERLETLYGKDAFLWLEALGKQNLQLSLDPFKNLLAHRFGLERSQGVEYNRIALESGLKRLSREVQGPSLTDARLSWELRRLRSVFGAQFGWESENSLYSQLEPKLRYENTLQALTAWLLAECRVQPVILHLADAQWLDSDSAAVLNRLLRLAGDSPLLILLAARPQDNGMPWRLQLPNEIQPSSLQLTNLKVEEVGQLLASVLEGPPSPALVGMLQERSQGNPLFVEQLAIHLRENGFLEPSPEGWRTQRQRDLLPRDVNSLLIARLDRLTPELKQAVQFAAVLGRKFSADLLQQLLHWEEGPFLQAVAQACELEIWLPTEEMDYLFLHILLREAAYQMQARSRLRKLHRQAAEALENLQEQADAALGELAHHWHQAQESEKARSYALKAAQSAQSAYAHQDAERFYRLYLSLLEEENRESLEARLEFGREVLKLQGKTEEARDCFQFCLESAESLGLHALQALALLRLAELAKERGHAEDLLNFTNKSLEIARKAEEPGVEGVGFALLGIFHSEKGKRSEALEYFETALQRQREVGDRQAEAMVLGNMGVLHLELGQTELAQSHLEEALLLHCESGERRLESIVLSNLGALKMKQGELSPAQNYFQKALDIHREIGNRLVEGVVLGNQGALYHQQGKEKKALKYLQEALLIHRETGNRRSEGLVLGNLGSAFQDRGELVKAQVTFEQALHIHQEIGNPLSEGVAFHSLGKIAMLQGRLEEAGNYYGQALRVQEKIRNFWEAGLVRVSMGQLQLLQGVEPSQVIETLGQALEVLEKLHAKLPLAELACVWAQVHLAQNMSGRVFLAEAERLRNELGAEPTSALAKALRRSFRAQEAWEAGEQHLLFRGQLLLDFTEGQLQWLVEQGHLEPGRGVSRTSESHKP